MARYLYRTEGVCPAEIVFELEGGRLRSVRFQGGGCRGNAELIARLVEGRLAWEVARLAAGVPCRQGTSCPDQLARAVEAALTGSLEPACAYRVLEVQERVGRLGVIGEVGGDADALARAVEGARRGGAERILVLGSLVGEAGPAEGVLRAVRAPDVWALAGEADWERVRCGRGEGLESLPQVAAVRVGGRLLVAFQGDYLVRLEGFSDYGPYALEMNMVCGLSGFLEREEVFPALAAMTERFACHAVAFAKPGRWLCQRVGRVDFVGVGPARGASGPRWGILEQRGDRLVLEVEGADG